MGGLLTGQFAYVFIGAILDAVVISWIALRWYRRSVRRLMQERGAPAAAAAAVEPVPDPPLRSAAALSRAPLTVALFQAPGGAQDKRSLHAGVERRRLSVAYGI